MTLLSFYHGKKVFAGVFRGQLCTSTICSQARVRGIMRGMQPIGEILHEKNLTLATTDPVARGGFTQVPNFILKDASLSIGAKMTYALFLSYAWHNNSCFPGQERLAEDMGMSRSRVTEFIGELEAAGLVTIQRLGQGKANCYTIHFPVKSIVRRPDVGRPTSRSRLVHH